MNTQSKETAHTGTPQPAAKQKNTFIHYSSIILYSAMLSACGGGGGGGSASTPTSESSVPQTTQVESVPTNDSAETSLDLNVSERFMFSQYQDVDVAISAQDGNGNVLANKQVAIYSVPSNIEEWNDEHLDERELVSRGKLDAMGTFRQSLELPGNVSQLLIQLSYIGMENKVLKQITNGTVSHQF